ncbi:hypothetical protein J5N97_022914 [Dioscorea zingiberensis]|uniref:Sphingolipid transporter spinster homolog 2 n=1 Tax=Dioscorea zingiberensis TaxID=325984 RepID=A0A9D5HBA2_9LILI|nr:hypothetical protein J5N97_022914 [Dioscorea zingiberensis]
MFFCLILLVLLTSYLWAVFNTLMGNVNDLAVILRFVGVGEASFISLAAPFIDDNAPPAKKTAWLAAFYMCIPTGIAVGYVYGGLMKRFQNHLAVTIKRDSADKASSRSSFFKRILVQVKGFWKDMKVLLLDQVYVTNVLGYIAYNFVIGAYSFWGPKAGYAIYHMSNADLMFGGITIICGIFGTLAGGLILDRIKSTISNAFKLLSVSTFLGAIFCLIAFWLKGLYGFIALFSVGELLIFATQAPVNYVCLHCVKPSLRPLSMAVSTVSIHIFGDVPSAPLVGVLQDHLNDWRKSALILTSILFVAAILWGIGIFLHSVDRFNEESTHGVPTVERANRRPLLDENTDASEESQ